MRIIGGLLGILIACAGIGARGADETADARKAIAAQYAAIGIAFANNNLKAGLAVFAADFQSKEVNGTVTSRETMQQQWKQAMSTVHDFRQSVVITEIAVKGDEAIVNAKETQDYTYASFPGDKQKHTMHEVQTVRDTWKHSATGWLLQYSETLADEMTSDGKFLGRTEAAKSIDTKTEQAIVAQLRQAATPFTTVVAGHGFDDLAPLDKIVGDARIVALGEASHGTAEFFQMKHRLLEYLVNKKGFTVFAIEANWPESQLADAYIKTGKGSSTAALAAMYFWTWNTEEVRDMIEWMRAYNQAPGSHPTLSFTSFDMQTPQVAAQRVMNYVTAYDKPAVAQIKAVYAPLLPTPGGKYFGMGKDSDKKAIRAHADAVLKWMDSHRAALTAASSPEAWREARQCAHIVAQCAEMESPDKGENVYGVRDRAMADNVRWLADTAYPGQKIVLWAHNGHVGNAEIVGAKSMGGHLREYFKNQMVVFGFAFDRGAIRAVPMVQGQMRGPAQPLPVPPAIPGSSEALFRQTEMPRFLLNCRAVAPDSPLGHWLHSPHLFREPGAAWDKDNANAFFAPVALGKTFDALIYIEESHASKALSRAAKAK